MDSNDEGYDPAFVKSILDADAALPEAVFDNIEDLLMWLEQE
jgi:hypothetical protein